MGEWMEGEGEGEGEEEGDRKERRVRTHAVMNHRKQI